MYIHSHHTCTFIINYNCIYIYIYICTYDKPVGSYILYKIPNIYPICWWSQSLNGPIFFARRGILGRSWEAGTAGTAFPIVRPRAPSKCSKGNPSGWWLVSVANSCDSKSSSRHLADHELVGCDCMTPISPTRRHDLIWARTFTLVLHSKPSTIWKKIVLSGFGPSPHKEL